MKQGLYEAVINEDILKQINELNNNEFIIDKENMDKEEAKVILSGYIERVIRRALNYIRDKEKDKDQKLIRQIEACNEIISLQQLGRGLRLSENKECLTVLDFVGQAHKNYNFEEKFRALVGKTNHIFPRRIYGGRYGLF